MEVYSSIVEKEFEKKFRVKLKAILLGFFALKTNREIDGVSPFLRIISTRNIPESQPSI